MLWQPTKKKCVRRRRQVHVKLLTVMRVYDETAKARRRAQFSCIQMGTFNNMPMVAAASQSAKRLREKGKSARKTAKQQKMA